MELNNTTKHANSHLAIMGKPGVGKTTMAQRLQNKYPDVIFKDVDDIPIGTDFRSALIEAVAECDVLLAYYLVKESI